MPLVDKRIKDQKDSDHASTLNIEQDLQFCIYRFFFPPFPDLEGPAFDVAAGSCFLTLPGCLGTNSAT